MNLKRFLKTGAVCVAVTLVWGVGAGLSATAVANESAFDAASAYEVLITAESKDSQAWFALAGNARAAGDLEIARRALNNAEANGLPPVRVSIEKARILAIDGDTDAAVVELQSVFSSGFTSVGVLTGDPVLSSMLGQAGFDELVRNMSVQAYPCKYQDEFRQFDFWLGEWDVYVVSGQLVGHNLIESDQKGCVLIENWTNSAGGSGMSVNFVDKSTGEWVQVWNAEGGSQINIRGGLTDEGMAMSGKITYVSNGTTAPFRALWTPLSDGRVRQYFEQSNDNGKTWVQWFEGFYTRVDGNN